MMNHNPNQAYNSHTMRMNHDNYSHSVWYPNEATLTETYYGDDGMTRDRLDSGSFSTSSSDDGNNKNKRRSHRPRGCRGGGSRRQRKVSRAQARESQQESEENVQPDGYSSYPPVFHSQYVSATLPKYVSNQMHNQTTGTLHEKPLSSESASTTTTLQPTSFNVMEAASNSSDEQKDLFSIFKPSTHQYTDSQGRPHNRVPYGSMTWGNDQNFAEDTAPCPRKRYEQRLAASSSNILHPANSIQGLPSCGGYEKGGGVRVLPPLLVDQSEKEPEAFEGPNPYALTSKHGVAWNVHHTTQPLEGGFGHEDTSRARALSWERIEKQRQQLAGGGSLFVTSPRSFLMGGRKPSF